ncbi:beta-1,3-galactosyltransferase 2-like [Orycteropus afer afer]|uniref:Hexosyltransferase n=1 Tax=Orycteropus afer afer TaxID=1230840 RepID=A0A8B7BAI7_ORYAF|nr:beta-1,3-galactosyltransferase 2-like [Orycteropus afer afer]
MNMFINCPLSVKNNLNTTKLTQETNEKHMYPQPYEFLINEENKCKGKTPFLVFLICSQPNESSHRDSIRNTWGNETVVPGYHVVRLFMLGVQKEYSTENIMQESSKYHDIIQQDFQDTYNNLTHKVLMGIKWVTFYCPNAHFVMKTDTDVFVNTETLIQKLLVTISPSELYFSGFPMRNASPIRNSNSKWYMPMDIYPQDPYPDFCSGTGYVFSGSLASKIYNASLSIKYIHLEDVYIGLCLQRLGVPIKSPPRMSFFNLYKVKFSPCIYNGLITAHYILPSEMIIFWNLLQAGKHSCSE